MAGKEIFWDAGAGSGPAFPRGLPAPCKTCCSPFAQCLRFAPSFPAPMLWGGLMLSLIFDVSEPCVKGFGLGDGGRDPTAASSPGAPREAGCRHLYAWTCHPWQVWWNLCSLTTGFGATQSPFLPPAHPLRFHRLMLLLFSRVPLARGHGGCASPLSSPRRARAEVWISSGHLLLLPPPPLSFLETPTP